MDHLSDTSYKTLHKLMKEASMPDFVMDHVIPSRDELDSNDFADTVHRKFPISTKADTFLSAAYAHKTAEELQPHVRQRLNQAVRMWGLRDDLVAAFAGQQKVAEEPETVIEYRLGDVVKHRTGLASSSDFDKIAEDISQYGKYPLETRKDVARQLLDTRWAEGRDVRALEKIAGYGTGTSDEVAKALQDRAYFVKREAPELFDGLMKLSEVVENGNWVVPQPVLEKTARFVDLVDRAVGLHGDIGKAEDLYHYTRSDGSVLRKYAVNMSNDEVLGSHVIEKNFPKLRTFLADAFGKTAESVKDVVGILQDLHPSHADLVVKVLGA